MGSAAKIQPSSSAQVAKQIKDLLHNQLAEDRADAARLDELRRIFARLIQQGDFQLRDQAEEASSARAKWRSFLIKSHKQLVTQLKTRIVRGGKRTAVRTLWGVVATSPQRSFNGQYDLVDVQLLKEWVLAMSQVPVWDKSIQHMVEAEFLQPFRDVQYYTMIALQQVADQVHRQSNNVEAQELAAERLVQLLMLIPLAASQNNLDSNADAYLFPAPESALPDLDPDDTKEEDEDSDDDEDEASSDDDEAAQPATKRSKHGRPRFTFELSKGHTRQWGRAWLAVLRLPLPVSSLKQVLQFLPTEVLPHVASPLLFGDFFIQAYQHNGVLPILALDGLFGLMTQHGLEYPDYYKQLYKLVTPSLFYVRYRTRFFRLLDRSIARNELLPAATVAAFIKRLVRSSLQAPPAGIMTALALVSNWLRKHPETALLVHAASTRPSMEDPFDAVTHDPTTSHALQSSLWEVQALSRHYYPAVVTLATAVGRPEQDDMPLLDMEDFYAQSYHNLLDQERKRQRKAKKTALTFVPPKGLFSETDVFADFLAVSPSSSKKEDVPVDDE
jgi:U3 small nucleolar RNA-associated protein 19